MGTSVLQCLFIGRDYINYVDVINNLKKLDTKFRFIKVNSDKTSVVKVLEKLGNPCLVFISDNVAFPMSSLSDLILQYSSDSVVVIVTRKTQSIPLTSPFSNTLFSKLNISRTQKETSLFLGFLLETISLKTDFRRCKGLLGISEKRCQWLVDSSTEAVAYISRDLHLYANPAYLDLFRIASLKELHSILVKDIIVDDEHRLFDQFRDSQQRKNSVDQSLLLSLKKKNNVSFRAHLQIIDSYYKGKKCYQLWVKPLDDLPNNIVKKSITTDQVTPEINVEPPNPFAELEKNSQVDKKAEIPSAASIMKGIIKRKEAIISAEKLIYLKKDKKKDYKYRTHHLVSLKVPEAQKKGIDDLLFSDRNIEVRNKRDVFWDKVKFARITQLLSKQNKVNINLICRISEASLVDPTYTAWVVTGLRRIGKNAENMTFLLPSSLDKKQAFKFINAVRTNHCTIAMDDFLLNKVSVKMIKQLKPEYVRLSLPWMKQIQGNNSKELGLSSVIRQLEASNIKVIAPCGHSLYMEKLFTLSGASFCQERTTRTD